MGESGTFQALAERHGVPAAVGLAGNADELPFQAFHGRAIELNSVFAIASMTKAITATAALQLVERGLLDLDEPAGSYLSALRELPVLEDFTEADQPRFSHLRYEVTVRQLLTHTAGFAYPWNHPLVLRYGASRPYLIHAPGTRWQYGINVDWVGRVIEALTGQTLEKYFRANIFEPLGMEDTSFYLSPERFGRFAGTWQRGPDGELVQMPRFQEPPPPYCNGGGGLFSTAGDYMRFLQMILRGGTSEIGTQILRAASVKALMENQVGTIEAGRMWTTIPARSADVDFHPGQSDRFSLAFLINSQSGIRSWGGIRNTFYWIDPKRGVAAVLLMQFLPFCDAAAMAMLRDFERLVYESL